MATTSGRERKQPACPAFPPHTYWDQSSPVWSYTAGGVPTFLANGDIETSIRYWEVEDLEDQLDFFGVLNLDCKVPGGGHGLDLWFQQCFGIGPDVADVTWTFFIQF